ncbi:hypothetical protein NHH03_07470 [Stieleria sp. TO1_6]|uniref:hypothetical protein n=1 Tax=Stieleria tagensis TaxID=2956795 RepID=UPI00209B768A|nr:hypothetical protein [Stieleria tagensis]MCO8121570.1 hypothetical protein [Stieleria tagensis]
MNQDRLSSLHLLPPPTRSVWSANPLFPAAKWIPRPDKYAVPVELPLFWYDPPWIDLQPELADHLAWGVANLDVVVSALQRDLSDDGQESTLFSPLEKEDQPDTYLPRMLPYRVERYGLTPRDFDHTRIIDVRLSAYPDATGRLAYSPQQLQRWERPSQGAAIAGGGYVAAAAFPTDVVSLRQMQVKLDQLRELAPRAAVLISLGPYRLEEEIAAALVAKPDGLILRMDQSELEGLQLAGLVRRARELMIQHEAGEKPLWIVPGPVSTRDIAKLIALGATAVAIDSWCQPLVEMLQEAAPGERYDRQLIHELPALVSQHLWEDIDRVIGILSSFAPGMKPSQLLGTFHPRWAKACGATMLAP